MNQRAGGLGVLFANRRVEGHKEAVNALRKPAQKWIDLVKAVLLKEELIRSNWQEFSQAGLVFLEQVRSDSYRATVPYPCLLNFLLELNRPDRFQHLQFDDVTGPQRNWRSKAFEALCAIRIAIEMDGFPYDVPCDPQSVAKKFQTDRAARVCLAERENQAGVDCIGVDGDTMILVQCKYPETDASTQEWREIDQFMNFIEETGVKWAKLAKCQNICAIFATGRASRDYVSSRKTELEVDGVNISYTLYAKTENSRDCAIQTKPINAWIPAGIMCF